MCWILPHRVCSEHNLPVLQLWNACWYVGSCCVKPLILLVLFLSVCACVSGSRGGLVCVCQF